MADEPDTSEGAAAQDGVSQASSAPEPGAHRYQVILWEGLTEPGEGIFEYATCLKIERELQRVIDTPKQDNIIDVWLQSNGGSADEAYRYMLLFREYAATVRVVVGRHAKSAATLMLIGADRVYMGPGSELGPLDAQIYSDELDRRISALDIARSIERLAMTAVDLALSSGAAIVSVTGIPRREVLPAILSFTSDFFEPMVAKMEPSAVYRAANQLRIASDYALRLLELRDAPVDDDVADKLVYRLVNDYPHHGFLISRHEALALGLPVEPADNYVDIDAFHALTARLEDAGTTAVAMKDLLGTTDSKGAGPAPAEGGVDPAEEPADGAPDAAAVSNIGEGDNADDSQDDLTVSEPS